MGQHSGTRTDDPLQGRRPTSHERMAGQPWDASYHDGPAPWDIRRPQPAVVRLALEGGFKGAVLDAGCGTGENSLYIAWLSLPSGQAQDQRSVESRAVQVLGIDVAETALAMAREKAAQRGIDNVEFVAADVFQLQRLDRSFKTVLDCGLFHTFDSDERTRYVASLASVTEHGGMLYVLCFSEEGPQTGPHPVREEELRAAFNPGNGWNILAIKRERIETRFHENGAPGWLVTIEPV